MRSVEEMLVLKMLTAVRLSDVRTLWKPDTRGRHPMLASLLSSLQNNLPALSEHLILSCLSHIDRPRHLSVGSSSAEP